MRVLVTAVKCKGCVGQNCTNNYRHLNAKHEELGNQQHEVNNERKHHDGQAHLSHKGSYQQKEMNVSSGTQPLMQKDGKTIIRK